MKEEGKVKETSNDVAAEILQQEPVNEAEQIKAKQEMIRRQKQQEKDAAVQLTNYKKRLRESILLKREQVEEFELNIKYFKVQKEWIELQPEIQKYEAEQQAKEAKENELREQMQKSQEEQANSKDATPKIVVAKTGKPRK